MHRRQFLTAIGAAGTLAATVSLPKQLSAATPTVSDASSAPSHALLKGTPAVFAPTPESLTITLPLQQAALAWIEYGETKTPELKADSDPWGFVPHCDTVIKIRLTGLKPGTRYYWRAVLQPLAGGEETRTPLYSSKTLSPSAAETRFSVWNDTHDRAATIQKLHALRDASDDFLLWNGDASNNVNDSALLPGLYVSPKGVNLAEGPPILNNHRATWLPATPEFPYNQLVGGGPKMADATLIRCHASTREMRLTATMIHDGSLAHEERFKPLE
jgi:hypothetical protein